MFRRNRRMFSAQHSSDTLGTRPRPRRVECEAVFGLPPKWGRVPPDPCLRCARGADRGVREG
eukprot:11740167-Alexandrium_andersonii.AAC.1